MKTEHSNELKELGEIVRQAREEHTQLLQYYRKIFRVTQDYHNIHVTDETTEEIHEWLLFAMLSYQTISQKLVSFKKLAQDVAWGLVKGTDLLDSLRNEMYRRPQFKALVSHTIEDTASMQDELILLVSVLDVSYNRIVDVQQRCMHDEEEEEFLIPVEELQRVCKSLSDVCDELLKSETKNDTIHDEEAVMRERAEIVKKELSAYQVLAPKLKEVEDTNNTLILKLKDAQDQIRDLNAKKLNLEKDFKQLQQKTKDEERIASESVHIEQYKKEIEKLKQNEITYQEAIDTLQYDIALIEAQNKELREKRVSIDDGNASTITLVETEYKIPHHDIELPMTPRRADYVDKTELESLKSTLQIMRRKQFEERSKRDEIAMKKLFSSESSRQDKKDIELQKKRVAYTKALAASTKQFKKIGVASVINLKRGSVAEWQVLQKKNSEWLRQRVEFMRSVHLLVK